MGEESFKRCFKSCPLPPAEGRQEEAFLKHEEGPPHSQIVLRIGWVDLKSSELPDPSSVHAGAEQPPVREAAEWCLVLGEELE